MPTRRTTSRSSATSTAPCCASRWPIPRRTARVSTARQRSDPIGRCTIERVGNKLVANCDVRTRAIFPEINDGKPPGAVLWRSRFADLGRSGAIAKGSTGDCTIPGRRGDLTHDGIDHIVISASLKKRLTADSIVMRVVNYTDADARPLRATPALALPSDHCPHVVDWVPLAAR